MGRCPIENLKDVRAILDEIRAWPGIREPKPGIFYLRSIPFLHFHEKDSRRWADIKRAGAFDEVELPPEPGPRQSAAFLKAARERYLALTK
jgi:hypothetical protein